MPLPMCTTTSRIDAYSPILNRWLDKLEAVRKSINIGSFVGQATHGGKLLTDRVGGEVPRF